MVQVHFGKLFRLLVDDTFASYIRIRFFVASCRIIILILWLIFVNQCVYNVHRPQFLKVGLIYSSCYSRGVPDCYLQVFCCSPFSKKSWFLEAIGHLLCEPQKYISQRGRFVVVLKKKLHVNLLVEVEINIGHLLFNNLLLTSLLHGLGHISQVIEVYKRLTFLIIK